MLNELYVVLIKDRHSDLGVEVFIDKEKAVSRARILALEYCRSGDAIEERQIADWVYYARYSCEGDCVSVRKVKVNL